MAKNINPNWDEVYKIWREFEGLRLKAYPDPATGDEPWTIGYGHTGSLSGVKVKRGDVCTKEQAEQYMVDDLAAVEKNLKQIIKPERWDELDGNQKAALISFSGNVKWITVIKSSVISYINEGKYDEVPGRMALYRLGDGKVMAGLVRRRSAEGVLWMLPDTNTLKQSNAAVKEEVVQSQGTKADAVNSSKPWDWGAAGALVTVIAGASDQIKKLVGNVTATFGLNPTVLLIAVGAAFAGWTIYNKWKQK